MRTAPARRIVGSGRTRGPNSKEMPMYRPSPRTDRGITTAEYAVGTAAGAGLAGLLYKMLTGGFGNELLQRLYDHVLRLLGI